MAGSIVPIGFIIFIVALVILLFTTGIISKMLSKKKKKYIGRIITGNVLIIYALFMIFVFWNLIGVLGPAQSAEDVATQEGEGDFKNYNERDIITIRDTISRIDPMTINNNTYTLIWFESSGSDDDDFNVSFRDDIQDSYSKGDQVIVFLEVDRYNDSSDREIFLFHSPRRELGAYSYQIYPSIYMDMWFLVIIIVGVIEIVLGIVGWLKKKPEEELVDEIDGYEEEKGEEREELPNEEMLEDDYKELEEEDLPKL